jgi:hypothetical protein
MPEPPELDELLLSSWQALAVFCQSARQASRLAYWSRYTGLWCRNAISRPPLSRLLNTTADFFMAGRPLGTRGYGACCRPWGLGRELRANRCICALPLLTRLRALA